MSNYGDFIVDFDSSKKTNFKHIHGKIENEIIERKNASVAFIVLLKLCLLKYQLVHSFL